MNTKLRSLVLALSLAMVSSFTPISARAAVPSPDARALLSSLPASDAVLFVDLQRIMTEIVPRLLARDPATLARMSAAVNEIKTKSGVNILAIDSIVFGVKFIGAATHEMKKDNLGVVAIAHGDFDANALIAFLRRETKGKLREETYAGQTIYSEPQPASPRNKSERQTAAVTILDANTVALGDLPQIRLTVDAFAGKERVDPLLVQVAERESSTFVGMAANVPASLIEDLNRTAPANDEMAQAINKAVAGIKQLFGSIGATPTDFNVITGARLGSAEQAASLSDMLLGLRQQVGSQVSDQEIRGLLDSLQITAQGDEIQIRADIKNEVVQNFVASMMKEEKPKMKPATATNKQPVRHRRSKRRKRH